MKPKKEQIISDYIVILKIAKKVYEMMDDKQITNQIETILEGLNSNKILISKKDILNTIGLYIDNLKTYDDSIIIPEGKTLLSVIK